MSDTPYKRLRDFHGSASGEYRVLASDTGLIPLVQTIPQHTIYVQTIHIEVTTPTAAEVWMFQDGVGAPLTRPVSAAAVAHFDFDFGPNGLPCEAATRFVLNITGASGAIGWITWEAYKLFTLGQSYAQAVLDLAPLGYWRLNERAGATTVADSSGNGRTGTVAGAVTLGTPSPIGTAAAFAGGDADRISVAATGLGGSVAICSFELWARTDTLAAPGAYRIALELAQAGNYIGATLYQSGPLRWFAALFINGAQISVVGPLVDLGWHHVVVTYDGIAMRLYVDSVMVSAAPATGLVEPSPGQILMGNHESAGLGWQGQLDEVAMYLTALSAFTVREHYRIALAGGV